MKEAYREYIGDGIWISWDGQVFLIATDPELPEFRSIYFTHGIFDRIADYVRRTNKRMIDAERLVHEKCNSREEGKDK